MARRRLMLLALTLVLFTAYFLSWNLRTPVGFILTLRAEKTVALILVGASAGAATVVFQTIASNRLLTPGIVGFDALFIFIQTMLVFILGGVGYIALPALPKFLLETVLLTTFAATLFSVLFRQGADDIVRMILTGVIIGTLFRAMAGFAQRLLEPSEFFIAQQGTIASFNIIDDEILWVGGIALIGAFALCMTITRDLDVVALGRDRKSVV